MFDQLRKTSRDKIGGVLRILLGVVFFLAGILKVLVQHLGEAFSGQLVAANIPLHGIVVFAFPIVEMAIGVFLVLGFHTRLSAAAAAVSMVVATYVHIAVEDPSLYPLQPIEPVGPLMLLAMAIYLMWRGGGAWSIDHKEAS
jgi:uncharacterized membrane protein YphA (DoxX/SURF4 family)